MWCVGPCRTTPGSSQNWPGAALDTDKDMLPTLGLMGKGEVAQKDCPTAAGPAGSQHCPRTALWVRPLVPCQPPRPHLPRHPPSHRQAQKIPAAQPALTESAWAPSSTGTGGSGAQPPGGPRSMSLSSALPRPALGAQCGSGRLPGSALLPVVPAGRVWVSLTLWPPQVSWSVGDSSLQGGGLLSV